MDFESSFNFPNGDFAWRLNPGGVIVVHAYRRIVLIRSLCTTITITSREQNKLDFITTRLQLTLGIDDVGQPCKSPHLTLSLT